MTTQIQSDQAHLGQKVRPASEFEVDGEGLVLDLLCPFSKGLWSNLATSRQEQSHRAPKARGKSASSPGLQAGHRDPAKLGQSRGGRVSRLSDDQLTLARTQKDLASGLPVPS